MKNPVCLVTVFLCAPFVVADDYPTYDETFTPNGRGVYNEDLNTWAYTKEFAERFAMPQEWINGDIRGAQALAFREEVTPGVETRCLLDVFIDSTIPLPWINNQAADFIVAPPSAASELTPQSSADRAAERVPIGFSEVSLTGPAEKQVRAVAVARYDKLVFPGLVYISFDVGCEARLPGPTVVELLGLDTRSPSHRIELPVTYTERLPVPGANAEMLPR